MGKIALIIEQECYVDQSLQHYQELSMVQTHTRELLNQKKLESPVLEVTNLANPLAAAAKRLAKALARLENNLQYVTVGQLQDGKQREQMSLFAQENDSLKQERETLNSTIVQLEDQYKDLHKVASTIYNKLDDSIKRLTQIMEN